MAVEPPPRRTFITPHDQLGIGLQLLDSSRRWWHLPRSAQQRRLPRSPSHRQCPACSRGGGRASENDRRSDEKDDTEWVQACPSHRRHRTPAGSPSSHGGHGSHDTPILQCCTRGRSLPRDRSGGSDGDSSGRNRRSGALTEHRRDKATFFRPCDFLPTVRANLIAALEKRRSVAAGNPILRVLSLLPDSPLLSLTA